MMGSEEYSDPLENRFIDKQGKTHWYNSVISKISFNGQPALQFITYDITERKQAEDALAEEKELLMVTLRSIGDGVITTDVEGRIILMNQIAESLTGWKQESAIGLPIEHVMQLMDPNTRKRLESPISNIITSTGVYEMTFDTLLIAKSGEEKLIADSGASIRDKNGKVIGTVIVFRDVTDKRKTEAERVKTMKLESVGLLAGGIAHDFNNILTAVLGNIALAKMEIESNNRQRLLEILNKSEKSTFRAKELTQQLLTFSRGGNPIRKTASIGELVRESADFMIRGSNVLCEYRIADDLWPVDVDQGQISQVIHNLVINSVQAMPVGGVIKITAENSYVENSAGNMRNGNYVKITLRDQGVGIPKEHLSKIFDPYFTTKQKGSGLGLATCYSIIRNHDGYIIVESDLGTGSIFTIYLPASESSFVEKKEYKIAVGMGHGRILIMDDEEDIREITTQILNRLGYESVSTSDGKEAIRLYHEAKESGKPFDVVIMDLTVPGGMGGKDATKKLLEYDPQARIIVASGYSNDPVMSDYKAHGFSGYIVKPFAVEEFKALLHDVLSSRSSKS
jgi:PAS domain S-box-containing protein